MMPGMCAKTGLSNRKFCATNFANTANQQQIVKNPRKVLKLPQ